MTYFTNEPLLNLYNAASHSNWEKCKEFLQVVLRELNRQQIAEIVMDYLETYFPRFKATNKDYQWVLDRIHDVKSDIFSGENKILAIYPERERKINSPIARAYRNAIDNLWSMAKMKHNFDKYIEFAADAIATMIMVFRIEHKDWSPETYTEEDRADFKKYGQQLWKDLAQKIERLLIES